ncbi:tryptophan halogenase family protein [Croceicoccus marinus]|uniref:Tryptophan 7-halogenase n=1 Tax=Croceicoccus marinus TaxID=450378 RepID=A0A1Z1FGZ8_9SPHN|nr:tryptophan halogenase family protein [Croceicoccus marinus]ARU17996.1 tryptophan halogenase [Croceicoccus marinus]QNE07501.1 tryptophan 7-halogenase [Croceicoccus marinus]
MESQGIRRVVIAGGGTAGWMAAAVMSKTFGAQDLSITLVESPSIGTVGVGEATIPPILTLNRLLGLDEDELVRRTGATFKLGIEFRDWGGLGERYIHPFGHYGANLRGVSFHQHWLLHGDAPLGDYSMTVAAAREGRFTRPSADPKHIHSRLSYALHFDAALYAEFLREQAAARGVRHVQGRIEHVELDDRGHVAALALDQDRRIEGDLFIDCTGFRGLLIGEALGTAYDDWSRWLPMDRALAVPSQAVTPRTPYTRSTAGKAGWRWRIPLQHRTGNGHVYCSAHLSDDEAAAQLLDGLDSPASGDPRPLRFTTGRRQKMWDRNVVALGLASGFLEPLESTSIHLIQQGVVTLMSLFPDRGFAQADIDEYNRTMADEFEKVRDFIILHYHQTRRDDSDFWNDMRTMEVPGSLRRRMDLFASHGRVFIKPDELFTETSWVTVMLGQGLRPRNADPVAAAMPKGEIAPQLTRMRQLVQNGVEAMPTHDQFIAAHCAAEAA